MSVDLHHGETERDFRFHFHRFFFFFVFVTYQGTLLALQFLKEIRRRG